MFMKRRYIIISLLCMALPLVAQQSAKRPNVTRLLVSMERLWKADKYLESMDTATYVLTIQPQSRVASDFVYRNWEKMQEYVDEQLQTLPDENDLDQAMQRCEIYRLLDEINNHFQDMQLPLKGANDRWVWQPEVSYYTGHYDAARTQVVNLLKVKAESALLSHDAESAKEYYSLLLHKYLVTDGERSSNREQLLEQCNDRLRLYAKTEKLNDALFAWDLLQLSQTLEPNQTEIEQLRPQLQEHISALYLKRAQQSLTEGDSIQAREYQLYAKDWQVTEKDSER